MSANSLATPPDIIMHERKRLIPMMRVASRIDLVAVAGVEAGADADPEGGYDDQTRTETCSISFAFDGKLRYRRRKRSRQTRVICQ
jgi:hypothetical protein